MIIPSPWLDGAITGSKEIQVPFRNGLQAMTLEHAGFGKRFIPFEPDIAPEPGAGGMIVRLNQYHFDHDALGHEGALVRKSLEGDLFEVSCLVCQYAVERLKRLGRQKKIDVGMWARTAKTQRLVRPPAEQQAGSTRVV